MTWNFEEHAPQAPDSAEKEPDKIYTFMAGFQVQVKEPAGTAPGETEKKGMTLFLQALTDVLLQLPLMKMVKRGETNALDLAKTRPYVLVRGESPERPI